MRAPEGSVLGQLSLGCPANRLLHGGPSSGLGPGLQPPRFLAARGLDFSKLTSRVDLKLNGTPSGGLLGYFFWPCHAACGILVPRPGIEPAPPSLEAQSLNHWTAREVPVWYFWSPLETGTVSGEGLA